MRERKYLILGILLAAGFMLAACAGQQGPEGPAGPQGPPGPQGPAGPAGEPADMADLSCIECHNDTSLISGKHAAWSQSLHGTNTSFLRGTSASCAGCHSGGAFSAMIFEGLNPGSLESVDPDPTRQDCRTCHQIHTTYTGADWALATTDPVDMFAFEGATFDGGTGNLCANCHQARRGVDSAVDGVIEITTTHWGPHHGPQSAMMLGLAGAGDVEGSTSPHYATVENTCVGCHLTSTPDHTFEPSVVACQSCHPGAENFDINGVQTEVQAMLDELEVALVARGWLDEEGHPAVASVPEDQAAALWNWIYIAHEDQSLGVHNPAYTLGLLEAGLQALR